jgi:hypothetical protein
VNDREPVQVEVVRRVRRGGLVMATVCVLSWVALSAAMLYGAYGRG